MSKNISEKKFLENYNIHDFEIPIISVDMAIFSVINKELNVLLVKRNQYPALGKYALPGGFVDLKMDHHIVDTAFRKLKEKTGVTSPYLEQVETIGNKNRDPRGWSITILYYALIDFNKVVQETSQQAIKWLPVNNRFDEKLAFDHSALLDKAVNRLRYKSCYTALPIELLPEKFTLTELQKIFEIILNRSLPAKSFRRRILSAKVIQSTQETKLSGKRSAELFRSTGLDRDYCFPRPLQD